MTNAANPEFFGARNNVLQGQTEDIGVDMHLGADPVLCPRESAPGLPPIIGACESAGGQADARVPQSGAAAAPTGSSPAQPDPPTRHSSVAGGQRGVCTGVSAGFCPLYAHWIFSGGIFCAGVA
jgi:hypothetical protein